MGTYTQLLYQIVFSTKYRHKTMIESGQADLYKFIWGVLKNKKCHLYRIGGVEDHLHIITHIHPSLAISDLIKDIKLSSSVYIKSQSLFPKFSNWQSGYGVFSYSISAKDNLIEYVRNQKEHHKKRDYRKEYIDLLNEHGVEFKEEYLF